MSTRSVESLAAGDGEAAHYAQWSPYLDRYVHLELVDEHVTAVSFPTDIEVDVPSEHELLTRISRYLGGKRIEFADVAVAVALSAAERRVLETVRAIPYGQQVRVAKLATMAGLSADDRNDLVFVQIALDDNPVPLVIPDHRVRDGPSGAPPRIEMNLRALE